MRKILLLILLIQATLVAAVGVALRSGALPLGIRGEWEWLRLSMVPTWPDVATAVAAVAVYAAIAAFGLRSVSGRASRMREALALLGLSGAAITVQAIVPTGAPGGFGLSKWAMALHYHGSSGYYSVAKRQVRDPWRFLADYPGWIRHQDALHVGTHPPGLFLVAHALLRLMEAHPGTARLVMDHMPVSVTAGFEVIGHLEPLPRADRAALALTGALTLLACAATVVPLYLLARSSLEPPAAWASAAPWPLVPSAVLFQPMADTAFPFLSTTALALAAHAGSPAPRRGLVLSFGAGLVLALGMQLTLAFLPVGLIVALVLAGAPGLGVRRRGLLIVAAGLGFLALTSVIWAVTRANPFLIWWWNQEHHQRFYVEFPRTYRVWVLANPVEFLVALGVPVVVWAGLGLMGTRSVPRAARATLAVLVVLNFSGRNLSEVARLWLPMMPPLLTSAGAGLRGVGGGAATLAATVALLGLETLLLQATIQVVYPV